MSRLKEIDQLVEKYMTAYKAYGNMIEIFENPTSAEVREVQRAAQCSVRVIMDLDKKKIYFFSGDYTIHSQAWTHIGDKRPLYNTGGIATAEYMIKARQWDYDSMMAFSSREQILYNSKQDWSFFKKWVNDIVPAMKGLS